MPKVSVIIPVYGVEKYIERCTVSLFEQTLDDMEFIFVDDCTPDRSMEILGCVIEKYRLRFAERRRIRDPRRRVGREREGRPDAGGARNRPPRVGGIRP